MVSLGAERRPGRRLPAFAAAALACLAVAVPAGAATRALSGRGMWIWYVSRSNGGDLASIAASAHQYGITTLMIKAGDGSTVWSQFSSSLVSYFHSQGISVCAWQYVYGVHPIFEAEVGAAAVRAGADCLLIDAEAEYEGKYVQAQEYTTKLRQLVGSRFPIGLASFPYVDYHPGLPYSVFLGPNGAQYDVPQMYWSDIQTTVDAVYSHTYRYNLPYQRPIEPLGEVAGNPPPGQVERFRQLSRAYGAANVSWWDWQEASSRDWVALSRPVGSLASFTADPGLPTLSVASKGGLSGGDLVVWAQEHLYSAGQHIAIDGGFGRQTQMAVQSFQSAHNLAITGVIDSTTWLALLRYQPVKVIWARHKGKTTATAARASGLTLPAPASAHDRARRYELPAHLGRG
jgi:peptidoglycan hydrolase-like protein with peptidoglycan-binding domain